MLTVKEMKEKKQESGLSYQQISSESGVPLGTVQKIFSGETKTPRYDTLRALEKVFSDEISLRKSSVYDLSSCSSGTYSDSETPLFPGVAEDRTTYQTGTSPKKKYDRQGTYTLEDYLKLPDDQRVELIDGVFYDMSAPYPVHQDICFMLGHYFQNFIDKKGGPCLVLPSPVDVQLDKDDRTIVEPDLCIVCKPEIVTGPRIYGAPDLLIEILSKSTRKKDLTLKAGKYSQAGVREYWTVDPEKLKVTVFDYENDGEVTIYGFHDKVPVGIYHGELVIDFEKIYQRVKWMYGVGKESYDQKLF